MPALSYPVVPMVAFSVDGPAPRLRVRVVPLVEEYGGKEEGLRHDHGEDEYQNA